MQSLSKRPGNGSRQVCHVRNDVPPSRQWRTQDGRCRSGDSASLGFARRPRPNRNEIWLRHRRVRRLHGPSRWCRYALVSRAGLACWRSEDRDDRRNRARSDRTHRAERMGRQRRRAVRLLPERTSHERGRAAEVESASQRHEHRRVDGRESVPLWNVRSHSRGDQERGGETHMNRRAFFRISAAATGGFLIAAYFDFPASAQEAASKIYPPDAFVHIKPNSDIVIMVNRLEVGQGTNTALPMILADELDADWSKVIAEIAPAADVYRDPVAGIQMIGGSISIANSFQQYRELGARTRSMLVAAAAQRWNV